MSGNDNMSYTSHCYESETIDPLFIFLVGGVAMWFVSFVGIIGNILSIIVLTRPEMKSSTNIILLGLSVSDFVFVVVTLMQYGQELFDYFCIWSDYGAIIFPVSYRVLWPMFSIARFGSDYFTVCVTVERFIVVYWPLRARSYCTVKSSIWASLIIVILAILYNMSSWWEISYENNYNQNGTWIGYEYTPTALLENSDYVVFVGWSGFIVFQAIPLTVLSALNLIIYKKVREANKMRKNMSTTESHEISVAKMLLCIVIIFLACNSVQMYLHAEAAFTGTDPFTSESEIIIVSDLLLNLNSAVNFIIYCLMVKKFRRVCARLFCRKLGDRASSTTNGIPMSTRISS